MLETSDLKDLIELKIKEAQEILKSFGLPESQQNKLSALTLLALSNLTPSDEWSFATKKSMTVVKDIMEFVNANYDENYKVGSRESFRKIALKPFVENNIALLNPDDPNLSTNSSNTHYSLSDVALDAIEKYKSKNWEAAVKEFKKNQFPENIPSTNLLRTVTIKNYKSILSDTIVLGRFNVFIGVNGCGKTNILEAIATIGAAKSNDLSFEELYARGVRIARPDLIMSSFLGNPQQDKIDITLEFEENGETKICKSSLFPENPNDIYTKWFDRYSISNDEELSRIISRIIKDIYQDKGKEITNEDLIDEANRRLKDSHTTQKESYHEVC